MYQSFPQRHYNRSNTAMPVIKDNTENTCGSEPITEKCEKTDNCGAKRKNTEENLIGSMALDDIILIGVILVLLLEGSNDILMLAILGIILLF